ncbi:MAG: hypothetical protein PWQ27_1034 [Kosmotoga sp.]|nr:hypothetical protein [Kosmotoga sp.]
MLVRQLAGSFSRIPRVKCYCLNITWMSFNLSSDFSFSNTNGFITQPPYFALCELADCEIFVSQWVVLAFRVPSAMSPGSDYTA